MPSYHWAKIWFDILDDWKIAPLSDHLWRRFNEFILIARKFDDGGFLPPLDKIAWILRDSPQQVEKDLQDLEAATRATNCAPVVQQKDGRWFVTNLMKRQRTMSDAERKRRQRERDGAESRTGHEDVTEESRVTSERQEDRGKRQEARGQRQAAEAESGAGAPVPAAAAIEAAGEVGISQKAAEELIEKYGAEELISQVEHCITQPNVGSTSGLVISRMKNRELPPARASPPTRKEKYATEGVQS